MLPAILHRMHQAKQNDDAQVTIWGDGTAKREFLYAPDLADFICFAIDNFEALPGVMNVGSGLEISVNAMHKHMAKVIGYSGEFQHDLSKPVVYADVSTYAIKKALVGLQKRHFKMRLN